MDDEGVQMRNVFLVVSVCIFFLLRDTSAFS